MTSYERAGPEIPRRPRGATNSHHPAIREIHKNAWLKRICSSDKKSTPFIKKVEKHWVVFCVHDDTHPFLEFYPEPKAGTTHKPISVINLNSCLHVSPSIIPGQDNDYEFAVTLPDQVVRLFAAEEQQMNEWIESLTGKLREMHILSPKDNLYSKLPEAPICSSSCNNYPFPFHRSHIQHRDPNSPLPPPPFGYISPVLGIEISRQDDDSTTTTATTTQSRIEMNSTGTPTTTSNNNNNNVSSSSPSQSEQIRLSSTPRNIELGTTMQLVQTFATDTVTHTISQTVSNQEINCDNLINLNIGSTTEDNITITTNQQPVAAVVVVSGANSSNTSVVRLNFDHHPVSNSSSALSTNTNCSISSSSSLSNTSSSSTTTKGPICLPPPPSSKKTKKPSLPQQCRVQNVGTSSSSPSSSSTCNPIEESSTFSSTTTNASSSTSSNSSSRRPKQQLLVSNQAILSYERQHSAPSEILRSTSHENIYEHLYIPGPSTNVSNHDNSTNNNNNNNNNHSSSSIHRSRLSETEIATSPPVIPRRDPKRIHRGSTSNSTQRSSSLSRIEQPTGYTDGRRRHSRSRNADIIRSFETCPDAPSSSQNSFNENRPVEAMIGLRKGEYRIRSDDMSFTGNSGHLEGRYSDSDRIKSNASIHVPLKEQQVMRLVAEIQNINGVRVVLKKKDCINSIAFVDYLGAVFICGWKQQQNILYYAFHVGDRVVKVAGVTVENSAEAYRAIKMVSSMQVEFIIRRLPFGRVLVLKRKKDEPVGLVCTGNSGEIGEVVKNGLASRSGLPSNCPITGQTDGQHTCNWFLTEINNRPLSLMAKESEVKERLNAVGKEITITLQPTDMMKHFRKHLQKSIKNYKEYLVV